MMKKTHKFASLVAAATVLACTSAFAQSAGTVDNWVDSSGQPWKNSSGECWRDAGWTPATAAAGCDGALKPVVKPEVKPVPVTQAPKAEAKPVTTVAPAVLPVAATETVKFSAGTLFDFGKSALTPAGRGQLDELAARLKTVQIEAIITVGHTDSVGSDAYNERLSLRRAEAVKDYLVSKGVNANRIYAEGKGEREPIANNKTADGRSKNRRVEVHVVGKSGR